jgi:hypothetical protein
MWGNVQAKQQEVTSIRYYPVLFSFLSVVRQAHHPELFKWLSESRLHREKVFIWIVYGTLKSCVQITEDKRVVYKGYLYMKTKVIVEVAAKFLSRKNKIVNNYT